MENGPSPDADFQPIRLVSFALTVQTAADPDPCLSERPGLACDALPGVGTSRPPFDPASYSPPSDRERPPTK